MHQMKCLSVTILQKGHGDKWGSLGVMIIWAILTILRNFRCDLAWVCHEWTCIIKTYGDVPLAFSQEIPKHGSHFLPKYPGGGHSPRKGLWECAGVICPPFSQVRIESALPSLPIYHQCAAQVASSAPFHSLFLEKFAFQPCFWPKLSSQDTKFQNFCSQDPSFFKENSLY